ncbi:MAG: hypothetical protein R3D71_05840 [Rickettsiales bacterium]
MRQFFNFLKDFKAGHLDAQLTNKMGELVESVSRFSKPGKLTVEITLKPKSDGEVMTSVKFKMKAPERDTMESIMFVTPENNLVDSNPKQPDLLQPIKEMKEPSASLVKSL